MGRIVGAAFGQVLPPCRAPPCPHLIFGSASEHTFHLFVLLSVVPLHELGNKSQLASVHLWAAGNGVLSKTLGSSNDCFYRYIPGNALHEKSSQRQIGIGTLVSKQERNALLVPHINGGLTANEPLMNGGSTAGFVPPWIYA